MANENDARVRTFALIIKFGHDLFACQDKDSIAAAAVNNSHALLRFRSSSLFRLHHNKRCDLLGQFAMPEVNEHCAQVLMQKDLIRKAEFDAQGFLVVPNEKLPEELAGNEAVYLLCLLRTPEVSGLEYSYLWLLEYGKEIPENVITTAQLLGRSVSEALSLAESSVPGKKRRFSRFFTGGTFRWCILAVLLAVSLLIPVRESSTAEFMLKAPVVTAAYARYDGSLSQCLKEEGAILRKGETVIRFDTSELQYRLANARSALKEAEADHELAQQNAFTDETLLGKVKLLQARCRILQVAVDEARWYLTHSEIKAPSDGILVLADERAELLAGKAVKAGEKLFEVYGGRGMIAEVMVNERDSSILHGSFQVELFLHTAPERGIAGRILSIAKYPVLTEQRSYCYPVRVELDDRKTEKLRFGMRGIAKISGRKICLGYYLFKSLILCFRNW